VNKHMRRGMSDGALFAFFVFSFGLGFIAATFSVGNMAYDAGVRDAASGKAVVRTLPDGTVKVYKASELKEAK